MVSQVQEQVAVTLAYGVEPSYGALSVDPGKFIPRVTSSLVLAKASFRSQTVRSDQEIMDARHGMRRVDGQVVGELMMEAWDDWFEAMLRGTWTATTPITQAEATSITADNATGKFLLGGGDALALGLKNHDVFRLSGLTVEPLNNGVNFRIVSIGGTGNRELTVLPPPATAAAETTFSLTVAGKKLVTGVQKRSFNIEQRMPDQDVSELFKGCRLSQMAVRIPPDNNAQITWDVMGQQSENRKDAQSPYFVSPAVEPVAAILAGLEGSLVFHGEVVALVTGLDFTFNNSMSQTAVLGSDLTPDTFHGQKVASGTISAFLEDEKLLEVFQNEVEVDIVAVLEAVGTPPVDFMSFRFPRCKLMGITRQIGAEGGVIAQFPFQALLQKGGAGTGYDQSSMIIQRSNS